MKKPIKEKIIYRRKMPNGKYKKYSRNNPYKKNVKQEGSKRVIKKNFIRSINRHLYKNDMINFISVEIVEDGVFLLHYAPKKPLKEGDSLWQFPRSDPGIRSKDMLLSTVNQMAELEAWKSKDYKEIFKSIIIENSVSNFDSKFKSLTNCYLLYSKETFENLLEERMGISGKMAKRLVSSLYNRIKYPILYNPKKLTGISQSSITSEKELFLELNLYAVLKTIVSKIQTFKENFLDDETTEEEQIDIIVNYIMVGKHHSYISSRIAYELSDTDISLEEYSKDNYGDVLREISKNKEDYITQFNTFLDGTIDYLKEISEIPVKTRYLIDSISEKIVPFMELNLLENVLEEFENNKDNYISKNHRNEDRESEDIIMHLETVMEKLYEGKELYELYKELKKSSGISIFLDSALPSDHKHILEQFIRYDQELVSDITSLELVIDLYQAVENESEEYMQFTNQVKEIAEILDIMVDLPF